MKFTLQRLEKVDSLGTPGVTGTLSNGEGFDCLTLDNEALMVMPGTYLLVYGYMASHGVHRAELTGVEGRSGIFIHAISEAKESLGCPGVGDSRPTPGTLAGGIIHSIADKVAQLVKDNPGSTIEILPIQEEA